MSSCFGFLCACALGLFSHVVHADLPVHCLRHQLVGDWDFFLGPTTPQRSSCGHERPDDPDRQPAVELSEVVEQKQVRLNDPNIASTAKDSGGRWTMIYDEAFEVNVDGLSFLGFSRFDISHKDGVKMNTSRCGESQLGWYRDVDRSRWGCYFAKRRAMTDASPPGSWSLLSIAPNPAPKSADYHQPLGMEHHGALVKLLNSLQSSWQAKAHPWLDGKSLSDMNSMAGIYRSISSSEHRGGGGSAAGLSFLQRGDQRRHGIALIAEIGEASDLPTAWDWRDVDGKNYLNDVIDQGDCGSCYEVSTVHMLSARHRIKQSDPAAESFSISFPLYCSEYNQGCGGGYPFLASRWSQDVGLVPESCAPYDTKGRCEVKCDVSALQKRWRADNHRYVGGYYGGSTEEEMKRELVHGGPLVASFEPTSDVMYYSGGVYHSVPGHRAEWERVDHAVLLVGYGEDRGQKYWLLQNSWGPEWGEQGFFRMARGTDESGIESLVVAADVVEEIHPALLPQFLQIGQK